VTDVRLDSLLRDISETLISFEWISFNHIYKELNTKSDQVSKEALTFLTCTFGIYEFLNNDETKSMEF
jgi:hypothetical protein